MSGKPYFSNLKHVSCKLVITIYCSFISLYRKNTANKENICTLVLSWLKSIQLLFFHVNWFGSIAHMWNHWKTGSAASCLSTESLTVTNSVGLNLKHLNYFQKSEVKPELCGLDVLGLARSGTLTGEIKDHKVCNCHFHEATKWGHFICIIYIKKYFFRLLTTC